MTFFEQQQAAALTSLCGKLACCLLCVSCTCLRSTACLLMNRDEGMAESLRKARMSEVTAAHLCLLSGSLNQAST